MDLTVTNENMYKVLKDVRELILKNILPRITELEDQLKQLRRVTWPVCQGLTEITQLDDMQSKREFLQNLDPSESLFLLKLKSKGLLAEELRQLNLPLVPRRNTR